MKKIILIIIALVLVGGGAFYGGMKYSQTKRQQSFQANIGESGQRAIGMNRGVGANFLNGEVISKDEQSLTLKLLDGGSKIIFFAGSTEISKITNGSINDIEVGKQIMVTGQQNSDGSITARTIQLSPRSPTPGNSE